MRASVADLADEVARQQRLHEAERTRRHDAEHVLRLILANPADAADLARNYFEDR